MSRSSPMAAPALSVLNTAHRKSVIELDVDVVTPLFGGSATPGETDAYHPVRAASVRGHLRFWWRACHAARYATSDALFAAESALWGNTETPSVAQVEVETLRAGELVQCATYNRRAGGGLDLVWRPGYPQYALFPFQGKVDPGRVIKEPAWAREGVRFRLRIDAACATLKPAQLDEVRAAVWAWLAFGGVGARTRRGCGSLHTAHLDFAPPTDPAAVPGWLAQAARWLAPGRRTLPVPSLGGACFALAALPDEPRRAWERAIEAMKSFRQVPYGRPGSKVPGRSRWPEADSIRNITHRHLTNHPLEHPATRFFPRADLGLPIVFHFQHQSRGDPNDTTLQVDGVKDATRMASPIILKALATSATTALPLALCLNSPHLWDTDLLAEAHNLRGALMPLGEQLEWPDLHDPTRAALVWPLSSQKNAEDARQAFMRLAARQWHTTVRDLGTAAGGRP